MAYPAGTDLIDLITNSGLTAPGSSEADDLAEAAKNWWERETGYPSFYTASDATEITKYFDPPGPRQTYANRLGGGTKLFLRCGFVSVSEVRIGISTDDAVGTLLVEGEDYELWPYDARDLEQPYTSVRFRYPIWGTPKSVSVKGVVGYCTTLSTEVTRAILSYAAYLFCTSELQGLSAGPTTWKEDDVQETTSIELLQKLGGPWLSQANRVMIRHKLLQ